MTPAARRIAFRSQRMPNSSSRTPMTSWSACSGTWPSSGPSASTMSGSEARPASEPSPAGRQPRTVATESTIVSASTASTSELRNAAETAGAADAHVIAWLSRCEWQARLVPAVLDPAAAESAIQIDQVDEALQARRDERELSVVEVGLRGEHVQIRVRAVPVAEVRKLQPAPLRRGVAFLGRELFVVGAARSKPVGH